MKCIRCGNSDPEFFYQGHRGYYCRKCIRFSRILLEEEPESPEYEIARGCQDHFFSFRLSKDQLIASKMCAECAEESDILLHCVCGSGKTEISVETIGRYLSQGKKVAYAISRKEVVIELGQRFSKIFPNARVIAVYGGHHEETLGDLIVCTCHQLYRYYRTFDLLILDEVDAFPLKGDETLMNVALNSCKGKVIFSTATVDSSLKKVLDHRVYKKVELYRRPSGRPLPVPEVILIPEILYPVGLFFLMKRCETPCIIFTSSRKQCTFFYRLFSPFFPCTYVYSDLKEREENIRAFRDGRSRFIFSTTVLERGITISNVSVIILMKKGIFDESSLIQMLGRVDRGIELSKGKAFLLVKGKDKAVDKTMKYLKEVNAYR